MHRRATRFVTGNNTYETGSMTDIPEQLKWESFEKRKKETGSRLIMLYESKGCNQYTHK